MGGSSKSVTVGYKYYLGMHMVLCHGPVDCILEVRVDGKTAWSGNSTGGAISINSPDLFGGESREGGIKGTVDIDMGRATQGANSYLTSKLGAPMPAFRGVVGAVLRQVYIGLNPYLKRWSWVAQRLTTRTDGEAQWYSAKAAIGEDMNPAHIIYECLTDRDWGMGYLASDIDVASFTAAADKLYSEGMGISLIWDKQKEIEEFIGVILKHVDGVLYVDRVTGLFTFRLTRGDYDRDSLLVFDESNIISVDKFNRPTYSELINSVTVVYKIARSSKNNAVTVQDIALAQIQNATIGTTIQYPGFRNGTIAAKVCARDLAARSTPLVFCTLQTTRAGTALNIGDVFRLSWPQYGLADVVMRVTNIQIGADPTDQKVKVDCVQDIFDLNDAVYAAPPVSEWEDPISGPQPVAYRQVYEVPYYEVASRFGDSAAQGLNGDSAFLGVAAVAPTGDSFNARIWVDAGSGYTDGGTADFCPTATLSAEVGPTATVLPISGGQDLDMIETGGYAFVGSGSSAEAVEVVSWTDTTVTVKRGVLDTVPRKHLVGSRIWFVDPWSGSDEVEYLQGDSLDVKLTPTTGKGTLAVTSAPTDGVTFVGRLGRPYPPGNMTVNGEYYPTTIYGGLSLSWAHRDRLQQTAGLIDYRVGDIGPEVGTTYRLRIFGEDGTLIREIEGLSVTSYSYPEEEEAQDSGLFSLIPIWTRDWGDGIVSQQTLFGSSASQTVNGSNQFVLTSGALTDAKSRLEAVGHLTDLELEFDLVISTSDSGVVYRTSYWGASNDTYGYFVGVGASTVVLGRGSNSSVSSWSEIQRVSVSYSVGQVVRVRMRAWGPSHRVWVDGVMKINAEDSTYSIGKIGLRQYNGSGVYDNMQISMLEGRLNGALRVQLSSERDGIESYQAHDISFDRAGFGFNFDYNFGG